MTRLTKLARQYWAITLTLIVGLVGIVLVLAGAGGAEPGIFSVYALGIAAWQGVGMVRDLMRGHWGLDIWPSLQWSPPWWSESTSRPFSSF